MVNQPETVQSRGEITYTEPTLGQVAVTEPTPPGRAWVIKAVEVLTITKNAAPNLLSGGSVSTDGLVNVLLSLARMQRGASTKAEKVGGILLPEEELPPESLGGARSITLCAGYPCSISNWATPFPSEPL